MRNGKAKLVMILGVAIATVILFPLTIILMNRPKVPTVTPPTPNAYDTLSEAGNMVNGLPEDYSDTEDVDELKSFVEQNFEALNLIEQAADQECEVPIDYEGTMADASADDSIRQAMRLLHAHARIAELEDDKAREAELYAKMFALSSKSANGGFMVHTLVAAAHERVALNKLKELAGELTTQQKREVLDLLTSVNRQPRNIDEIVAREHILVKKEHGTLTGMLMIRATKALAQPAIQRTTAVDAEIVLLNAEVIELLAR